MLDPISLRLSQNGRSRTRALGAVHGHREEALVWRQAGRRHQPRAPLGVLEFGKPHLDALGRVAEHDSRVSIREPRPKVVAGDEDRTAWIERLVRRHQPERLEPPLDQAI